MKRTITRLPRDGFFVLVDDTADGVARCLLSLTLLDRFVRHVDACYMDIWGWNRGSHVGTKIINGGQLSPRSVTIDIREGVRPQ